MIEASEQMREMDAKRSGGIIGQGQWGATDASRGKSPIRLRLRRRPDT